MSDGFDGAAPTAGHPSSTSASPSPGRGDLPDTLLERPLPSGKSAKVVHGDDPGDFYCEHAFFVAQKAAQDPSSSVVENARGEKLVGFLHVPPDEHTYRAPDSTLDQNQRQEGMRDVIGAGLRGYFEDAAERTTGDVRLLLTGYGKFQSVQNNPTGDFVGHPENLDAALASAFGDRLLTPTGEDVPGAPEGATWRRYRIQQPDGTERALFLEARKLDVDDTAIDGGARSLQSAMDGFGPHAVLSLGVASGDAFRAEFHADDGGLNRDDGSPAHDWRADPAESLPDNYSLARAITRGSRPPAVRLQDLRAPPPPSRRRS